MNTTLRSIINDSGKTSAQIAALFAPVPAYQAIDLATLDSYLQTAGIKRPLIRLAANPATPQQLADGLADFLDRVDNPKHIVLDYSDADVRTKTDTLIGALVSLGQMTADQAAAIKAMGTIASYPAGGPVTAEDVDAERLGMAADVLLARVYAWRDAAIGSIDDGRRSGTLPTLEALAALFGAGE